ncbi:MAG: mandelate racemase/muconate lactonizing enzyme family protein [Saccharothrix sp.]|nr:mandelate racemase/muconate lactonizing enzyme family protein [Saccharothrix sp.]
MTTIELFRVGVSARTTWWFLRLRTPHGTGLGECSDAGPTAALVQEVREVAAVIGDRDPVAHRADVVADLAARARSRHGGYAHLAATVLGGLDQALVDIAATVDGVPAWKWLGGQDMRSIPLYANINRVMGGRTPYDVAATARRAVADGFRAVKCAPFDVDVPGTPLAEAGLDRLRAVRHAVDDDIDVLADFHEHLTWAEVTALLPHLADLRLGWLEDVVPLTAVDRLLELRAHTDALIAGGELVFDPADARPAVDAGAVDVLMPDIKHIGGPCRALDLAETFPSVRIAPHNPSGPVGTLAAAHLLAATPNGTLLEYAYGEVPWRSDVVRGAEVVRDGHLLLGDAPGFGLDLDTDHPAVRLTASTTP